MLDIDYSILYLIIGLTAIVVLFFFKKINDPKQKLAIVLLSISVFAYSGYGIALNEVSNTYLIKYLVALICLLIPFLVCRTRLSYNSSSLDVYFSCNRKFLKNATVIYFVLIILPLLYPRFRLFDIVYRGISIDDIYDYINAFSANVFQRSLATLALFVKPFFYAYIVSIKFEEKSNVKPCFLFLADITIQILDSCYIGRSAMAFNGLLLFFLLFCIKDENFSINRKQIVLLISVIVAAIPFMYAYTFIRAGLSVDNVSFGQSANLLVETELDYPKYYDHILRSRQFYSGPINVIFWLICLPIPSIIWPNKPTMSNDMFTYTITGLNKTDYGYSSLLPSFLGELFMYFGETWYWVFALIVGFILVLFIKYLSKSKYMLFYTLYLIVRLASIGRAGASAALPLIINGSLSVLILDWIITKKKD